MGPIHGEILENHMVAGLDADEGIPALRPGAVEDQFGPGPFKGEVGETREDELGVVTLEPPCPRGDEEARGPTFPAGLEGAGESSQVIRLVDGGAEIDHAQGRPPMGPRALDGELSGACG